MKELKIVTIGGGSSYTPELVEGLIRRKKAGILNVKEFWLVDIEEGKKKLEIIAALAKRMVESSGVDMEIHASLDRREALKGADFVTTQFRVGKLDSRIEDERRAYRFGLIGQETNGVGGFTKTLRTVPVILDICRDIEEICPDAWLVNFANPSGMVTEAILRYTKVKAIGVCNRAYTFKILISKILECDPEKVHMDLIGLNHFFFINDITVDGISYFEKVHTAYKLNSNEEARKIQKTDLPVELMDAIQSIPNAYLDYYFMKDKTYEKFVKDADTVGTRGEVVQKLEAELFQKYEKAEVHTKPAELEQRGGAYYSDAALDVIDGIANDRNNVQYVNIQNQGALPYLSDDAVIECTCLINKDGAKCIAEKETNALQKAMISLQKAFEQLTIECAVEGSYDKGLMALTINPLIFDAYKARDVLADLLEGNRQFLPQFRSYFEEKDRAGK